MKLNQLGGLPLHLRNVLSVIKHILTIAAVTLATGNLAYASHQHSGPECYQNGHRIYVPDGFNYPRQSWASWGISCRTPKPEIAAGSGATAAESGERPVQWCGWWMRQHLGAHYGPEFNVARNWLNVGRPLDGPRPGAIGVKANHVFQVVRVVDRGHVLAISGNDHNAVQTRIRPTSDVIGWRDVTEERTAADKAAAEQAAADKAVADKAAADKAVADEDADKAPAYYKPPKAAVDKIAADQAAAAAAADKAAADKADGAMWADKLKQWEEEDRAAEAAALKAAAEKAGAL
jgi:hypothetical protein